FTLSNTSTLSIDIEEQTITIDQTKQTEKFELNPYKKTCLLNGYDDIDFLLSKRTAIENFEKELA
ncbi:hypothetical protein ACEV75_24485, partial [Vibrio parahaemolyticus]